MTVISDTNPVHEPLRESNAAEIFGLKTLTLHQFRNYPHLELSLQSDTIILTGPNGAGKTNVLESISFFSPGRGLRGVKLSQVTNLKKLNQDPKTTWVVSGSMDSQGGVVQLGTALDFTAAGTERRLVKIDSQAVKSQSTLTDWLSVIWVTPQMDRLFMEGASARRKYVDRLVYALDPIHASRVHRYEHHMRERSRLLREGHFDPLWVGTLERRLAEDGVAIAVARQHVVQSLVEAQMQEKTYPFPQFSGKMQGEIETALEAGQSALMIEDAYGERLKTSRSQDGETGGASIGPHRSDFCVSHLAKQLPAELCSTGEQKMILLAVTLAFTRVQAHNHTCPTILLLDDVVAHLDDHHREVLFQEICHTADGSVDHNATRKPLQVWMTGTDASAFQNLSHRGQFLRAH